MSTLIYFGTYEPLLLKLLVGLLKLLLDDNSGPIDDFLLIDLLECLLGVPTLSDAASYIFLIPSSRAFVGI